MNRLIDNFLLHLTTFRILDLNDLLILTLLDDLNKIIPLSLRNRLEIPLIDQELLLRLLLLLLLAILVLICIIICVVIWCVTRRLLMQEVLLLVVELLG